MTTNLGSSSTVYGALGVGKSVRHMLAATFVLEDHQAAIGTVEAGSTSAVAQAIIEELLIILISIIVTTIIINSANSSN